MHMRLTPPSTLAGRLLRGRRVGHALGAASALALASAALSGPALAADTPSSPADASSGYAFHTIDNQRDPTFNQLLGINNAGVIAGYYGSGQTVGGTLHPN